MNKLIIYCCVWLILASTTTLAQMSGAEQIDSSNYKAKMYDTGFRVKMSPYTAIGASASIAYGFAKFGSHSLNDLDILARKEFALEHPHSRLRLDDYLQFAPGASVFVLSGLGIKGKSSTVDQSGIYLLSNIILNITVQSLKRSTKLPRPDGTSNSFPSGHTAEAFASAELLNQEYGRASTVYPVLGYATALSTAYLRMYNNKHWLSDVVTGAGIGFFSTRLSYWLYPKIKKVFSSRRTSTSMIMPSYSYDSIGARMVRSF
ncbi:phosphatase PAP2 family protein [Pedobacter nutrimenti]|uniref:PAP2 superfamily protein n=1 Tax=Pedobacter nutrimenti TaxID=1241337 RepID=A0A318UHZ4_9SPHI|nr:phosphatase PAP2 family protein [Pedobacter nutrimenti]PYF74678.1 PAP2 superfamily protein [Pedobacter nutrimenti]